MSIVKRLDDARKAYARRDENASAAAHDPDQIALAFHGEEHGGAGSQYIGDFVYGGLDGIITTFAVVSGVAGANLGTGIILILGIANLLADGFSMATGAYLSTRAEQEYYDKERQRETWEVEHFPEGERAELYELYRRNGYSEEEAEQMLSDHILLWCFEAIGDRSFARRHRMYPERRESVETGNFNLSLYRHLPADS